MRTCRYFCRDFTVRFADSKSANDLELPAACRERTLSENSNPNSILSDYDPMPTILEETDEEIVAEIIELSHMEAAYWHCDCDCDEDYHEC